MKNRFPFLLLSCLLASSTAPASDGHEPVDSCHDHAAHAAHAHMSHSGGHSAFPDIHAPISVMGDHTHGKGSWMVSYRYMRMDMEGMRRGTDRVSSTAVFDAGFTVTPEKMTMDMHMLGAMYGMTEKLTLMLMVPYVEMEMDHRINPAAPPMLFNVVGGDTFTTESSGFGDTRITALYSLDGDRGQFIFGLGLSLPTGSIDEKDNTPQPGMPPSFPSQQLPASMQLGSGTFDLLPSLTYTSRIGGTYLGGQLNGTFRLEDENDNGYRRGHAFEAVGWAARDLGDWLAVTAGLGFQSVGELEGRQADVGRMGPAGRSVTTAFSGNYGGERLDVILGASLVVPSGLFEGHRIACDVRLPAWQDLNGYQLETDSVFTLGWQKLW